MVQGARPRLSDPHQCGVAGIPLYLWYPAGGGAPEQLPQVLGPDAIIGRATQER